MIQPPYISSGQQIADKVINAARHIIDLSITAVQIGAGIVTNAKLANMAAGTVKAGTSGGLAPVDLPFQRGQANVGTVNAGVEVTTAVTLSPSFPNTNYRVFLTTAQTTNEFRLHIRSNAKATGGFNIITSNSGVGNATFVLVDWVAIGD